jgi:hypothetical protein
MRRLGYPAISSGIGRATILCGLRARPRRLVLRLKTRETPEPDHAPAAVGV